LVGLLSEVKVMFFFSCFTVITLLGIYKYVLFFCVLAGKYAQVTNNPENDGCINAVLLV